MSEIIFNGPAGRLEGRYQPGKNDAAPVALILHQHPQYGGTMDNKIAYYLYHVFAHRGFATMRFNFRGIGRSQGEFDNGVCVESVFSKMNVMWALTQSIPWCCHEVFGFWMPHSNTICLLAV